MPELRDLSLSRRRVLPARLLSVRYSRAGGPGGQNVNKVATKADVRLDLTGAVEFLGEDEVARVREKLANRLDADGNLQVVSAEQREQAQNVEAALARMEGLLRGALARPKPRRPTKPTRASRERRLMEKRRRGETKQWRGGVPRDE